MLKIEKVNRYHDYTLKLRKREKFFNRTLLIALSLAFMLHGVAILIFHIGPFKILNNGFLPPAFVETDVMESEQNVVAKIDGDRKLSRFPFIPKTSSPMLPPMPKLTMMRHLETIQGVDFIDNLFIKAELDLQYEIFLSSKKKQKFKSTIQVMLSGQLSDKKYEFLKDSLEEKAFALISKPGESVKATFAVKVENKTGQIFFVEPKKPFLNDQYVNVIEKILKEIRFEKEQNGFVTSGDIEIVFNEEALR